MRRLSFFAGSGVGVPLRGVGGVPLRGVGGVPLYPEIFYFMTQRSCIASGSL